MLNSGNPRDEAEKIFQQNFPTGFMGTTSVTDATSPRFFTLQTDAVNGRNIVTVTATAVLPTTFMRLGILMRVANDRDSPDFNSAQLEGKYYFAATASDVGPAFQALQNEIIRLSK